MEEIKEAELSAERIRVASEMLLKILQKDSLWSNMASQICVVMLYDESRVYDVWNVSAQMESQALSSVLPLGSAFWSL